MAKMKEQSTRYRFAVPDADTSVIEWLDAQMNLSVSLRLLIKDDIIRNGCTDVTCRSVEQLPKRGRPTNAELERRAAEAGEMQPPKVTKAAKPKKKADPKPEPAPEEPEQKNSVQLSESVPAAAAAHAEPAEVRPAPQTSKPVVKPAVSLAEPDESRESVITSLFSGGSRKGSSAAASMGLLADDED